MEFVPQKHSDRKIILFLVLAIFIEASWLCYDIFKKQNSHFFGEVAGHILSKENQLLRKASNSLTWDSAIVNEELSYHDSVMTLSQSGGKVYLQEKTEVTLSENTMITIDPPLDEKDHEIHLKLSHGDLRARNPFAAARISHQDWKLKIEKGSDIDIRQLENDQYQILVKKGEAQIKSELKTQILQKDQLLNVDSQSISSVQKLATSFAWQKIKARIYSLNPSTQEILLSWQGPAKSLISRGRQIDVAGLTSLRVPLQKGMNHFQAVTADGISELLSIELWEAPNFHLIEPLPRSRIKTGESHQFIWQGSRQFSKYKIEFHKQNEIYQEKEIQETFQKFHFDLEADLEWQVKAFDHEGYEIPAPYSYPLFIREKPFSAPQLRRPLLRQPAHKNSTKLELIYSLFVPSANAAIERPEAVFSWQSVEEADYYVIEISDTPDFRKPLINQKIETPKFVWPAVKMQKYYWRVAAGSNQGRLGLFSEPLMVDFENFTEEQLRELGTRLRLPKMIKKEKSLPAPIVSAELPLAETHEVPPEIPDEPPPELKNYVFTWEPSYSRSAFRSAEGFTALLKGGNAKSFSVERNSHHSWKLHFEETSYKADPPETYPFQPQLTSRELSAHLSVLRNFGVAIKSAEWFERTESEKISTKSDFRGGIFWKPWAQDSQELQLDLTLGSKTQDLSLQYQYRLAGKTFLSGVGLTGELVNNQGKLSDILTGFLIFGFATKP